MTSSPIPPPRTPRRDDQRMRTAEMAALRYDDLVESETLGSGPVRPPLPQWNIVLLVAAGGALGTMLRFVIMVLAPVIATPTLVELPWSTFWINTVGCLGLGALTGVLEARPGRPWLQPLLGTGLCGGFTSMSAVVLEGSAMIGAEFPIIASGYALLTIVVCLGAVVVGILSGRRITERVMERSARDQEAAS